MLTTFSSITNPNTIRLWSPIWSSSTVFWVWVLVKEADSVNLTRCISQTMKFVHMAFKNVLNWTFKAALNPCSLVFFLYDFESQGIKRKVIPFCCLSGGRILFFQWKLLLVSPSQLLLHFLLQWAFRCSVQWPTASVSRPWITMIVETRPRSLGMLHIVCELEYKKGHFFQLQKYVVCSS